MTDLTEISTKPLEHSLPGHFLQEHVRVLVVGCGGTGSAIATGLVHLHQAMLAYGHPHGLHVTLVDGDRISRANCVRQPFSESEIGLYKADVLATRINLFWGLGWKSDVRFIDEKWNIQKHPHILISCVDSRNARKLIMDTEAYWQSEYWLDLGNSLDTGQFVMGEPERRHVSKDRVRLPNIADLFPEIVNPKLDAKDKLPSCSALEALEAQSPFINQALAYQALGMLAQFFRHGKLTYHGGFMSLQSGRFSSLPIDPEMWKRIAESKPETRRGAQRKRSSRVPSQQAGAVCR